MDEVTLAEVQAETGVLVLLDGRHLLVIPSDIPVASLWLPRVTLEVVEPYDARYFDLLVTLQGTDQQIRARWDT
jgi:hypothetical protein